MAWTIEGTYFESCSCVLQRGVAECGSRRRIAAGGFSTRAIAWTVFQLRVVIASSTFLQMRLSHSL